MARTRPPSPTVSRRELANTLRHMRQQAGNTLEEAAAALETSAATLSRIETGIRVPRARDVKDLCEFYGVTDTIRIAELTSLVAGARESGWWESYTEVDEKYGTYIGFEDTATAIDEVESTIIPNILQTATYGAAYLKGAASPARKSPLTDHDISKSLEVRARRQQLLTGESGLTYRAVLDEAVLLRMVGGRDVMREQVGHLIKASERQGTEILVLPLERGAHPGQIGSFTILTLPQEQVSDVVYVDTLAGQIFLETPEELRRHRQIFAHLQRIALDATDSRAALLTKMAEY